MSETAARTMRADARRNRLRVVDAARQLLVEQGAEVALDKIATRAGVSIATFYRRFEDRAALLKAIVLEESETIIEGLDSILTQVGSGMDRATWEHELRELVLSARSRLAPVLVAMNSGLVPFDQDVVALRARMLQAQRRLILAAQEAGLVRADTTPEEVMTLFMHAMQPLPHLSPAENQQLTGRLVGVLLAGLHPDAAVLALPGEPFEPPTS